MYGNLSQVVKKNVIIKVYVEVIKVLVNSYEHALKLLNVEMLV